ncbi:MAG: response regulator [Geobacter sp.]|nr:response regulator [Geobacter sp.]
MDLSRCLIVDDEELGRELVAQYLQRVPVVVAVGSGEEAVEKFRAAQEAGEPFELVLLDIVMPGMDGIATGTALRKMEKERGIAVAQQAKIIMLTARNTPLDVMQSLMSVQSAAYLVKPVEPDKFRETLSKVGLKIPR